MSATVDELHGLLRSLGDASELLDEQRPRIDVDPDNVERGLARLVLTVIELLRQLMERQAIRRMEGGSLTDEEVERLGDTFALLDRRMTELRLEFGLEVEDLNLDLGPLGRLL